MFKLLHFFCEYVLRPILHRFGYDMECHAGWVPPEKRDWALMSEYRDLIVDFVPKPCSRSQKPKIIWQFWWQGVENAPIIVKRCLESVRYFMGSDYKIIVLDKTNVEKFIHIDENIKNKHDAGTISHTFFSDYIRVKLLAEKGGIWIDSTVFLSGRIPQDILDADFFIFKSGPFAMPEEIVSDDYLPPLSEFFHRSNCILPSTWFLVAKPNSPLNSLYEKFLIEYWRRENRMWLYFTHHYFITYSICVNKYCREEFVSAPTYLNVKPHYLMFRRNEKFNEKIVKSIFAKSAIHKMTYKYTDFQGMDNSIMGKMLNGELLEYAKHVQQR